MEKLLHERLREFEKDIFSGCQKSFHLENGERIIINDISAKAFADEIERCYIPRPRFEDGEPVSKGCEVDGGIVDGWCVWDDGAFILNDEEGNILQEADPGEFVKRPTPKVYDADGVEIKVGEKLYNPQGDIIEVRSFEGDEDEWLVWCGETKYGIKVCYKADECTHERPVFDAEGVRICKDDTVWNKEGTKLTVTMPYPYERVYCEDENGKSYEHHPSDLTHREPDSIDRIIDDATKDPRAYYNEHIGHDVGLQDDATVIQRFAQHLIGRTQAVTENAALIERGA